MLIEVLFIKAENKSNSHVHQLMKRCVYTHTHTHTHTHTVEYYIEIKMNENVLENIKTVLLSEELWTKNHIHSITLRNSKSRQTPVIM